MSFNHGTSHLSGQQQAIIRQREKNDEIRKQESKKQNDIICKPIESNGDYRAVVFEQGVRKLLELRVSGSAIANGTSKLDEKTIVEWLERIGSQHVKLNQPFETVLIISSDVVNGELVTDWKNLKKG